MKEYYKTLRELPVFNYYQIMGTGNLSYLYKLQENGFNDGYSEDEVKDMNSDELIDVWDRIYYSQKRITITEQLKNEVKKTIYNAIYLTTNQLRYKTQAEIIERKQTEQLKRQGNDDNFDIDDLILSVEEYYNFNLHIDKYTFSAEKFLNILNNLKKRQNEKTDIHTK